MKRIVTSSHPDKENPFENFKTGILSKKELLIIKGGDLPDPPTPIMPLEPIIIDDEG